MNNLKSYLKRFPDLFPKFGLSLLIFLVVAVVRYFNFNFNLAEWSWQWLLDVLLFVVGAVLSHLIFLAEPEVNRAVDQAGHWMAREDSNLTEEANLNNESPVPAGLAGISTTNQGISQAPHPTQPLVGHSWLRNSTFLLILPLLAVYLLTSSHLAIGFGFLYGLSLIYLLDIWSFARNQNSNFLRQYFWTPPPAGYIQTLIMGYGLYFAILTVLLIIL